MIRPSINVLRTNVHGTAPLHDAFLHFLVRLQPTDETRRTQLQNYFEKNAVIASLKVGSTSLPMSPPEETTPILTVVLVEPYPATGNNGEINNEDEEDKCDRRIESLKANLQGSRVPWSPNVIVACLGEKDAAIADFSSPLETHFPGAALRFVDVLPSGEASEAFWWWRCHQKRVAVLPSSGRAVSAGLKKTLGALAAAGIKDAEGEPLICSATNLLEPPDVFASLGLLVLDLQDGWCFEDGPNETERQKAKNTEARQAFLMLLKELRKHLTLGADDIRTVVSRSHASKDLHPAIKAELGHAPKLVPDTVFTPLSVQLSQITAEQRHALSALLRTEEAKQTETVSETMLTALEGRLRVIQHRISLQEARSGGDIAARLDALFEAGNKELGQIVEHSIERMIQRLRAGAYHGVDNTKSGDGSRDGPRWINRFPLCSHLRPPEDQGPDDGKNWLVSKPAVMGDIERIIDRKINVEPNEWIKQLISEAISSDCKAGLARLSLTTDLFFETVIRGESRAMLRELEVSDSTSGWAGPQTDEPLPSGAHVASGLSGRRAAEAVAPETLRLGVPTWPEVQKLPTRLNIIRNFKSLGRLTKQAGKLIAALVLVVSFSDVELQPSRIAETLTQVNACLSFSCEEVDGYEPDSYLFELLFFAPGQGYYLQYGETRFGLVLLLFGLATLYLTIRFSVNAHLTQLGEKLDKLRDDTHKMIEDAAIRQLSAAKKIMLDVIEDDMATLRSDLAAAIQARDGKALKSLHAERQALEDRIATVRPLVKENNKKTELKEKEEKSRRDKLVRAFDKTFSLKVLQP